MFSRHQDFQQVMARQHFLAICRNLTLKANIQAGEAQSAIDPLHSGCHLINTVAKSFAEVAVPVETSDLDEASFRLNAQNKAVLYLPSKPDHFAVRLYCMVGTSGPYMHSIWDNGRGNASPASQVDRYNHLHKVFGFILNNHLNNQSTIDHQSASALWICQMVHKTKLHHPLNGVGWVIFMDSFYMWPRLAEKLCKVSDGNIKMTGTCNFCTLMGLIAQLSWNVCNS